MQSQTQKWGNSLGVRIPAALSKELGIKAGSVVDIFVQGDHSVVKPNKFTLDSLLHGMELNHFQSDSPLDKPQDEEK